MVCRCVPTDGEDRDRDRRRVRHRPVDRPPVRLSDSREARTAERVDVSHVIRWLRDVGICLYGRRAVREGVVDRCVEERGSDSFAPRVLVDREADDRPDRGTAVVVSGSVLRRTKQRRVFVTRSYCDPADRLAALVGEQPRLAAAADQLFHRAFLRFAVPERAVAPIHAPAAVRGHVAVAAAGAAALEQRHHVRPAIRRYSPDLEAHASSSSRQARRAASATSTCSGVGSAVASRCCSS